MSVIVKDVNSNNDVLLLDTRLLEATLLVSGGDHTEDIAGKISVVRSAIVIDTVLAKSCPDDSATIVEDCPSIGIFLEIDVSTL